jgi:two-component system OmpR family sensor kinase
MKVPLPRRLRSRLALKQTFWFALLVIVLAWSAYAVLARRASDRLDNELQDRSIAVRSMLQVRNNEVRWLNKEADAEVRQQFAQSIRYYQLFDDQHRPLESSQQMLAIKLPWTTPAEHALQTGRPEFETFILPSGLRIRILDTPVRGVVQRHYIMRVGMSLAQVDEDTSRVKLFILILLPCILLAHGVIAWHIAGKELQPLERMTQAARQISPLNLNARFPVSGRGDDLDQLSITLNTTIARLQSSFQRMSEFLRNLSHEIRQPLTVMRAEAEQALRSGSSDESVKEMLSSQLEHVQFLARTVSDLMELAQSDADEVTLHCQTEDLSELVQAAFDGMRLKAAEQNIHLSGTVQQNMVGQFDAGQIWRLLLNLLDNAIKYNHPNGRVDVNLSAHEGMAILTVSDTGPGITPEEQQHVFQRGYRAPSNRKSASGTGLGLYFVRAIARAHGGDVDISSVPGQGSCLRVSLPVAGLSASAEPAASRSLEVN